MWCSMDNGSGIATTLEEGFDGLYLLSWKNPDASVGNQFVSLDDIEEVYPWWCEVITSFHIFEGFTILVEHLFMCAAYSIPEPTMKDKRAAVYKQLGKLLGHVHRFDYDIVVCDAIKAEWHDEDEEH
ncbi:unnamed protein product [Calypogeia fissa]